MIRQNRIWNLIVVIFTLLFVTSYTMDISHAGERKTPSEKSTAAGTKNKKTDADDSNKEGENENDRAPKSIKLDTYRVVMEPVEIEGINRNLSGVTFHPETGTLFGVTNYPEAVVELTPKGKLKRTFPLGGAMDTEGIMALSKRRLAVVEEGNGRILFFTVPPEGNKLKPAGEPLQVDISSDNIFLGNSGLEGVTFNAEKKCFYCVKEKRPSALYRMTLSGKKIDRPKKTEKLFNFESPHPSLSDVAGCHFVAETGNLLVISQENTCVIECNMKGKEFGRLSIRGLYQPEGVTMDDEGKLYVVGEPDQFVVYAPERADKKEN